ncbi:MAG: acetate kinase [candidate division WOR-3 bacterium]
MIILTINCGSSSVKYMVYNWDTQKELAKGIVERVTLKGSFIRHKAEGREEVRIEKDCPTHKDALNLVFSLLVDPEVGVIKNLNEINAVGHRVLHGGEKIKHSIKIDKEAIAFFKSIYELGPLHLPPHVTGIEAAMELLGNVPHIAVLDTAFHSSMPEVSYIYPVPYEWYEKYGVRKYGFHGTSHLYVSRRAAVLLEKDIRETNLVTCHIGNGVSLTAIKNGRSYDHSMGLTPLEGLVMGTRSGSIDPAIIQFICEKENKTVSEVIDDLNHRSGLLGISGKWSDRRDILREMSKGDKRAELAFNKEVHTLKKFIGGYIAILGRVDAIVFTAGAGEKATLLREAVCLNMEHIGIKLDIEKNKEEKGEREAFISTDDSPIKVLVIPTNEEIVFVEDVVGILKGEYESHETYNYSFSSPNYKK